MSCQGTRGIQTQDLHVRRVLHFVRVSRGRGEEMEHSLGDVDHSVGVGVGVDES